MLLLLLAIITELVAIAAILMVLILLLVRLRAVTLIEKNKINYLDCYTVFNNSCKKCSKKFVFMSWNLLCIKFRYCFIRSISTADTFLKHNMKVKHVNMHQRKTKDIFAPNKNYGFWQRRLKYFKHLQWIELSQN